jgi:nitroreductase
MPEMNPDAMAFLLSRRSTPAKTLTTPVPTREALIPILEAAARSPDHGKLEPWRFIVLEKPALARLAALVGPRAEALGIEPEKVEKAYRQFADADLAVAVVSAPVVSEKVPEIEQIYSAGAVCLALLNAALASGWGANWLTGWPVQDREFLRAGLGLVDHERIAGLIHIGTPRFVPPDRPRPDLAAKTTWMAS